MRDLRAERDFAAMNADLADAERVRDVHCTRRPSTRFRLAKQKPMRSVRNVKRRSKKNEPKRSESEKKRRTRAELKSTSSL